MTRGPSYVLVSPPAIATSNSLASGNKPSYKAIASRSGSNSLFPFRGNAREMNAASGLAAIAARSLRLAAKACRPIRRGSSTPTRKSTPSVNRSVVTTTSELLVSERIAASSRSPSFARIIGDVLAEPLNELEFHSFTVSSRGARRECSIRYLRFELNRKRFGRRASDAT